MIRIIRKIKEIPKLKRFISIIINITKKSYMFLINKIIGIRINKIVFISFNGKTYSDNPRAISEKLHCTYPNFDIVWLFNNPEEKIKILPSYIRCIKAGSFSALKELATAKFWIDNSIKPYSIYKSREQSYIQTWHGDRGFKKILYDSSFVEPKTKYIESKICDLFLSGSDYADKVYASAFHYRGKVLKFGCPRNDKLMENSLKKTRIIKEKLNISPKINILLFAPTLRRNASVNNELQNIGEIDLLEVIQTLENKTNQEWVCLVRAHIKVEGLSGVPKDSLKIIDVTHYEEMSEILLISDLLITDYSSSAADFALLERPIILFQADRDEYLKYDRTFYFNIDESPYIVVNNQRELSRKIRNLDWDAIPQNCMDILNFYGTIETGEASKKVVEYIISKSKI
jgi:CDP-glycerol glycerophosphotransferase